MCSAALRAGQKVLTVRGAMPCEIEPRQMLCADADGSGLHSAVRVEARERKRLEQLCSYIIRLVMCDERAGYGSTPLVRQGPTHAQGRRRRAPGDVAAGVHSTAGGAAQVRQFSHVSR